jgi:hypothetical protein
MDDQSTCGTGLAANATLPATVGELMGAMADVLDVHQRSLDLTDQDARPEHHAYVTLVLELRSLAAQLAASARRMASHHDLPMGRHDMAMLSGREALSAFEQFVRAEQNLLSLLTLSVAEHETMLERMR